MLFYVRMNLKNNIDKLDIEEIKIQLKNNYII